MRILRSLKKILLPLGLSLFAAACAGDEEPGSYVGYVEAEYIYVGAPQPGWIVDLNLREGDEAKTGDLLFSLDKTQQEAQLAAAKARALEAGAHAEDITQGARPEEIEALEAELKEAKARLAQAKAEYDRWIPLVREGNATAERGDQVTANYEAAKARFDAAEDAVTIARLGGRAGQQEAAAAGASAMKASVQEAQWRLDQRDVKAEKAGRVEEIFRREGEYVAATAPVLALLPEDGLKVRFFVPQGEISKMSVGAEALISADGLDAPVKARISFIASEAEFTPPVIYSTRSREKLVFLVEARLPPGAGLRPGLPADVSVQ